MNNYPAAGVVSLSLPISMEQDCHRQLYYVRPEKKGKHVRFADHNKVSASPSPLDLLNDNETPEMWFSAEDLDSFRNEARNLCRLMRSTEEAFSNCEKKVCTMAMCQQTRGLESRACLERQRRKLLATKCIVRAQSQVAGERLAALAQKCTRWASVVAQEEAARDFQSAHPTIANTSAAESTEISGFKHTLEQEDGLFSERRVRQRVSTTP
eukprot:CAMPEP_0172440114 /NCGR_PEP_ID=MMETSP1065-20121228/873_1 /TAXON_ID=265537 /ORGANISM="Amphiprora paludosa, Strain CCMP125" /LENGTH=210 /DNA_ID=CAMNT_0013188897 /DNA_START=63 /DNA_END=695 /DNA_ORIENTATION=-